MRIVYNKSKQIIKEKEAAPRLQTLSNGVLGNCPDINLIGRFGPGSVGKLIDFNVSKFLFVQIDFSFL
jgi:hypothetical protein